MLLNLPTIILIVIAILGLLLFGIILSFFSVWLRAWLAGAFFRGALARDFFATLVEAFFADVFFFAMATH